MFVLAAKIHRSGAVCREYYQPEETGIVPGTVFGLDGAKRAKQYQTEEEAIADIPAFRQVTGFNDLAVDVVPV
jgi:hypothetical protein